MGNLVLPKEKLCYECHDDFHESTSFLHGPADAGYCTQCHDPHQAKAEKLLVNSGPQLCFQCHDSTTTFNNTMHLKLEELNCLDCHDPHGGENASYSRIS